MTKRPKAVYEPGELDRVRGKLGNIDQAEAKRMVQLLGGEVGTEKNPVTPPPKKSGRVRRDTVELVIPGRGGKKTVRSGGFAGEGENEKKEH